MNSAPTPIFPYGMSALRYGLLTGPVDLAPLHVLASRCVPWQAWSVTFCVLGASHAVCLERGAAHLTELLACAVGNEIGIPVMQEETGKTTNLCLRAAGLLCKVTLIPFALTQDTQLSSESAPENRLEFAYPPQAEDLTPYTRIGWHVTSDALYVETVHTYPEEGCGVRSRTLIREEETALR